MSTLKSDNSDLTINADGSGKNIKLQANGSEKVVIKSDGKVGIGTIDPANTLHVKKDVDDFVCKIENDGNSTSSDGLWIDTRWNTSNNTMLKVTTNSGTAEVLRVTPAGLTFNGDTAAANALDDYEEGTWSPTNTGTATISDSVGRYIKVGKLVTVEFELTYNSAGSAQLSSLPFTVRADSRSIGATREDNVNGHSWMSIALPSTATAGLQNYLNNSTVASGYGLRGTLSYEAS